METSRLYDSETEVGHQRCLPCGRLRYGETKRRRPSNSRGASKLELSQSTLYQKNTSDESPYRHLDLRPPQTSVAQLKPVALQDGVPISELSVSQPAIDPVLPISWRSQVSNLLPCLANFTLSSVMGVRSLCQAMRCPCDA